MVFAVQIINHAEPEITVTNADSSNPPITYAQIKQSLGTQVYKTDNLYMYSTNGNQLLSVIQYQRYDGNGNQERVSIASTVDPYQANNVAVDLNISEYPVDFILNGNGNLSFVIQPLTEMKITLYATRLTNSFGGNLKPFEEMEKLTGMKDFYQLCNKDQSLPIPLKNSVATSSVGNAGGGGDDEDCETKLPYILLLIGMGIGVYVIRKKQ